MKSYFSQSTGLLCYNLSCLILTPCVSFGFVITPIFLFLFFGKCSKLGCYAVQNNLCSVFRFGGGGIRKPKIKNSNLQWLYWDGMLLCLMSFLVVEFFVG